MAASSGPVYRLFVEGAWADVCAPSADELQAFYLCPKDLGARRRAEVAAYIVQVRRRLTAADRRFLRTSGLAWPTDPDPVSGA